MSTLSEHHKVLTNGIGKCSVPMWIGGYPAGFCDEPAFGKFRTDGQYYTDPFAQTISPPVLVIQNLEQDWEMIMFMNALNSPQRKEARNDSKTKKG